MTIKLKNSLTKKLNFHNRNRECLLPRENTTIANTVFSFLEFIKLCYIYHCVCTDEIALFSHESLHKLAHIIS